MATLSFTSTGGDGYPRIINGGMRGRGFIDAEVLKSLLAEEFTAGCGGVYARRGELAVAVRIAASLA